MKGSTKGNQDDVVRTSQLDTIERLRHRLAGMWDRSVPIREVIDVAVLQLERGLDAGLSIGPGIPESTYRKPTGGPRKKTT